jgi:hypothetical protein
MTLVPAALMSLSTTPNAEYEQLIAIITNDPVKLIESYIKDWYQAHRMGTEGEFPEITNDNYRRADLKRVLLSHLPDEGALIDRKISEFEAAIGFGDEDFMYGGRRKTRKNKYRRPTKIRRSVKRKQRRSHKKRNARS